MNKRDIEANLAAAARLAQTYKSLNQMQSELTGQTAQTTRNLLNMFDLVDGRATRTEKMLKQVLDILTSLSDASRSLPTIYDGQGLPPISSEPRFMFGDPMYEKTMSRSESQLTNFFARAVKRGLRGL